MGNAEQLDLKEESIIDIDECFSMTQQKEVEFRKKWGEQKEIKGPGHFLHKNKGEAFDYNEMQEMKAAVHSGKEFVRSHRAKYRKDYVEQMQREKCLAYQSKWAEFRVLRDAAIIAYCKAKKNVVRKQKFNRLFWAKNTAKYIAHVYKVCRQRRIDHNRTVWAVVTFIRLFKRQLRNLYASHSFERRLTRRAKVGITFYGKVIAGKLKDTP